MRSRSEAKGCWLEFVLGFLVAVGLCILLAFGATWVVVQLVQVFLSIWAGGM